MKKKFFLKWVFYRKKLFEGSELFFLLLFFIIDISNHDLLDKYTNAILIIIKRMASKFFIPHFYQ